jgi:thiamine biosynthesis lipoprotein
MNGMEFCSLPENPPTLRLQPEHRPDGLMKARPLLVNVYARLLLIAVLVSGQPGLTIAAQPLNGKGDTTRAHLVVRKTFLMGTEATLRTYSGNREKALRQLELFIRIVEETEDELSTWRASSDMSRINALPLHVPLLLSDRMCRLLSTLRFWNQKTAGAFDPAVGRLVDIWDLRGQGRQASAAEISEALANSGIQRFDLADCVIERTADARFDAGAFGKGVALRRIQAKSKAIGATPWLINFGGQIAISGSPPNRLAWDLELASPGRGPGYLGRVRPQSGSFATSGSFLRDRWVEGVRVGHILDPRSGWPAKFVGSVTVWNEDPLVADILSTALFVMGPREGLRWAEKENVAACYQTLEENGGTRSQASRLFYALAFLAAD